jgi:hypothetical protein
MISKKFWIASIASIAAAGTIGFAFAQGSPNLNTTTNNQPGSGAGGTQPMDSGMGVTKGPSETSGAVGASTSTPAESPAPAPAAEQPTQADRG